MLVIDSRAPPAMFFLPPPRQMLRFSGRRCDYLCLVDGREKPGAAGLLVRGNPPGRVHLRIISLFSLLPSSPLVNSTPAGGANPSIMGLQACWRKAAGAPPAFFLP